MHAQTARTSKRRHSQVAKVDRDTGWHSSARPFRAPWRPAPSTPPPGPVAAVLRGLARAEDAPKARAPEGPGVTRLPQSPLFRGAVPAEHRSRRNRCGAYGGLTVH